MEFANLLHAANTNSSRILDDHYLESCEPVKNHYENSLTCVTLSSILLQAFDMRTLNYILRSSSVHQLINDCSNDMHSQ